MKKNQKYYLIHRKQLLKKAKIYYQNHQEELKKYRKEHKLQESLRHKKYVDKHQKEIKKYAKRYSETHKKERKIYKLINKKKLIKQRNFYCQKNKQKINEQQRKYAKNRKQNDIKFKLRCYLAVRIFQALKCNSKSTKTINLLGCSIKFLKQHLEKQFTKGMTWNNYGKWHIDHIQPCVLFNLSKPSEQLECFNYKNLRPLWAKANLSRPKDGSDL